MTGMDTGDTMLTVEPDTREIAISRVFDASRERVFEAWTDPDQVDQWWGPDGFSTTTDEMDLTPGGVWEFEMVGPVGEEFPNRIVYDEVERPGSRNSSRTTSGARGASRGAPNAPTRR